MKHLLCTLILYGFYLLLSFHSISINAQNSNKKHIPLNFVDSIQIINERIVYANSLNDKNQNYTEVYEYFEDLKLDILRVASSLFHYSNDRVDTTIYQNISKICVQQLKVLMQNLELKKEWAFRGIFIVKN